MLISIDTIEAEILDVIDGSPEANGASDIRCARFELVRQIVVCRPLESD